MGKREVLFGEVEKIIDEFIAASRDFLAGIDFVVGVSRGGLIPAAMLAAQIGKPLVAAYINKNDEIFFDRAEWIKGKKVLVVDDIIRSGKTLWLLKKYLEENSKPKNISFFTLFKVNPLVIGSYNISAFSRESDEDIVFPWDYDRKLNL